MATLYRKDGDTRHVDSSRHNLIHIVTTVPFFPTHLYLLAIKIKRTKRFIMCTSNNYISIAQAISTLGCALLSGTPSTHPQCTSNLLQNNTHSNNQ